MAILIVIAASWLLMTLTITAMLMGAKRSNVLYRMLFGAKPNAEIHQLTIVSSLPANEQDSRLVA